MSQAFATIFRFGRTPQPSNGDSNNASVPSNYLSRSSSSAHHREPRNEAYRSATPAVRVTSSTSWHRTNAKPTRPPLVEDEVDADEIYRRIRAAPLQPSPFVGWQHSAHKSAPFPSTRPSTARPSLDIPERGTFQDRPHIPSTGMRRRATNDFPMSDSEASGRLCSRRPESRLPSRIEDRVYPRQYEDGAVVPPVPSLPVPFLYGLCDLSRAVATSNKYPSAHGGSSDVWKASWRSDNGFPEVAVKVVPVPVDNLNPEMKSMMNNRLPQALSIWQPLDSQYIIPLYGPFPSLVCSWMGGGTLTTYCEGAGHNPNGTPPTNVVIPKGPSQVPFSLTFISLCRTLAAHPATVQLCAWSSLIGLAQAASVDQSLQTPVPQKKGHKILLILLPILFLLLLVASLVAMWWARRRAARRAAQRGIPAPRMPSRPMSTPPPVYLRLTRSESLSATSRARHTTFSMANMLNADPIVTQRSRREWSKPEIILAGFGVLLTLIGLVLGGVSLLYTKRQVSRA